MAAAAAAACSFSSSHITNNKSSRRRGSSSSFSSGLLQLSFPTNNVTASSSSSSSSSSSQFFHFVLVRATLTGNNNNDNDSDTRIHWENQDDGWLGLKNNQQQQQQQQQQPAATPHQELNNNNNNLNNEEEEENRSSRSYFDSQKQQQQNLSDLLKTAAAFNNTHYEFLGVSAEADMEEIKAAYRRLSKEYHPDTTNLPIKAASENFMRLREVYNVLSNEQSRKFYDWGIAQEAASRERMKVKLEDPWEQDIRNYESVPDMVDRLGGRNMPLSDDTVLALSFDVFAVLVSIACITYVVFFKEPS